jgi:hypothetical protein
LMFCFIVQIVLSKFKVIQILLKIHVPFFPPPW